MKKYRVQGYIDYRNDLSSFTAPVPEIPFEDYEKIAAKRDGILEKYCREDKITREELEYATNNYKKMSKDQITDFLEKLLDSKKIIKESDHIEGNLDKEFMLDKISDARTGSDIFKTDKMFIDLTPETMKTLEGDGFYTENEIKMQLGLDRVFGGGFWRKEIERVSEEMGERYI